MFMLKLEMGEFGRAMEEAFREYGLDTGAGPVQDYGVDDCGDEKPSNETPRG